MRPGATGRAIVALLGVAAWTGGGGASADPPASGDPAGTGSAERTPPPGEPAARGGAAGPREGAPAPEPDRPGEPVDAEGPAEARARWVLDRIEEEVAVIVGDGESRAIPRRALGTGAREGDLLDERLVPDPVATARARAGVAKLRSLAKRRGDAPATPPSRPAAPSAGPSGTRASR